MGNMLYIEGQKPPEIPDADFKPTYDPSYGFEGPRKERVSKLSVQEMKALQLPKNKRDYCASEYKDYLYCRNYYKPFHGMCNQEHHAWVHCQYDDYTMRIKEFEREKRLRMREARKQGKTIS